MFRFDLPYPTFSENYRFVGPRGMLLTSIVTECIGTETVFREFLGFRSDYYVDRVEERGWTDGTSRSARSRPSTWGVCFRCSCDPRSRIPSKLFWLGNRGPRLINLRDHTCLEIHHLFKCPSCDFLSHYLYLSPTIVPHWWSTPFLRWKPKGVKEGFYDSPSRPSPPTVSVSLSMFLSLTLSVCRFFSLDSFSGSLDFV